MRSSEGAADLDPAHHDLARGLQSGLDARLVDVDHDGGDARPGIRSRDPRAHQARAEYADTLDFPRLDALIGDPRVAVEPVLHEEDADQVRRDGRPEQLHRGLLLDLQALIERLVAALLDGLERHEGRGVLALGLTLDRSLGHAEGEHHPDGAEANRLRPLLAIRLPLAGRLEVLDPAYALVDEPLGRDGVKRQADGDGLLGVEPAAPRRSISIGGWTPTRSRQPLGAAPRREQAQLGLGQGDRGVLGVGDDPLVHGEDHLGSAAHARAIDEGDRREREHREAIEQRVAALERLGELILRGEREHRKFVQVGPGDELAGLAAADQEAAEAWAPSRPPLRPRRVRPGRAAGRGC